jgi:hypothetical protein
MSGPLQYVVSLNPPLILCNYLMNPLQFYEIDVINGVEQEPVLHN